MTQQERILDFIDENGFITSLHAAKIGIMDLQGNIQALEKKGYKFEKVWTENHKTYSLVKEDLCFS